MRKLTTLRKIIVVFTITVSAMICVAYTIIMLSIPGEMVLIEGEEYFYKINSIFPISIKADTEGIIKLNGRQIETSGNNIGVSRPVLFSCDKGGSVRLNLKFFGLLPAKTVQVDIVSDRQVTACGNTIGVRLDLDGILVIGISDVENNSGQKTIPVKNSGIKPGYIITKINGKAMDGIPDLVDEIDKSKGGPIKISYKYNNDTGEATVYPVLSSDDKKYHIGLWVRDSTAGIGTLTFYDTSTRIFGALGHGITDIDTGTLMSVDAGEILESSILGVKMGRSGEPGELKGIFSEGSRLGEIKLNSEIGIYGKLDSKAAERISGRVYPVGVRADVKEGSATILSNIDGKRIEEYSIEIQKVSRQNLNGSKGMIIKITDKRLLDTTGGIVQGMSGSPIIQNNKLIGAVTHVLVNDPTRGYGIFIEAMLRNSDSGLGRK
jgi:stage IV sporulation protein B